MQSQREVRDYETFLQCKVTMARASVRADRGKSNEDGEKAFAARRATATTKR